MMSERKIHRRGETRFNPKKDWVELSDDSWACVWELSVAENFQVSETGKRHPQDPRGEVNEQELSVWLIAYSARDGDEPGSRRIYDDMHAHEILELPPADFSKLLIAARGLLEATPEAQERALSFTGATPDSAMPSTSSGASSISTGSPVNLGR